MAWKTTRERARKDLSEGKRPSTAAGEFVREEMEHVRRGKHGVSSPKQAIAIGLDKARRSGVPLPPKENRSRTSTRTTKSEPRAMAADQPRRRTKASSSSSSRSTSASSSSMRSRQRGGRKK